MEEDPLSAPTEWPSLIARILAVLALVLAIASPTPPEAEALDGHSIGYFALLAFHGLTVLACARESFRDLRRKTDTRSPASSCRWAIHWPGWLCRS